MILRSSAFFRGSEGGRGTYMDAAGRLRGVNTSSRFTRSSCRSDSRCPYVSLVCAICLPEGTGDVEAGESKPIEVAHEVDRFPFGGDRARCARRQLGG